MEEKIPKGYKQTEVGVIPEDWETVPFNKIFKKIPSKNYQIQSTNYQTSGLYPVIDQGKQKIVGYSDRSDKVFKCPTNGIIVFGDHTREFKYIDFDFIVGADGTQLLTCNNEYSPLFLYYSFLIKEVPNTGYNRHYKYLKEMFFQIPVLEEQTAIATVLNDIDQLIASLQKLIAKKKLIKKGAMQELLTGKRRLPEFKGGWESKSLENCGKLTMGQSPPGNSYNSNGVGMPLLNGAADLKEDGILVTQYTTTPTRFSKKGDLLFCIRATIGNLQISDKQYCLGRGVAALNVNDSYSRAFVAFQLQGLFETMRRQSQGGVIKGLRKDELAEMTVKMPKQNEEQTAIAQVLSDMDAEIEALEKKRDKYKLIKQGAMQMLLTGRVRLV